MGRVAKSDAGKHEFQRAERVAKTPSGGGGGMSDAGNGGPGRGDEGGKGKGRGDKGKGRGGRDAPRTQG